MSFFLLVAKIIASCLINSGVEIISVSAGVVFWPHKSDPGQGSYLCCVVFVSAARVSRDCIFDYDSVEDNNMMRLELGWELI